MLQIPKSQSPDRSCPESQSARLPSRNALLVLLSVVVLHPLPAHAYLDPASGSLFLQMLLGGVAGGALLIRMYWRKFLGFVGLHRDEGDGES